MDYNEIDKLSGIVFKQNQRIAENELSVKMVFESLDRAFDALSRQQTRIEELERRIASLESDYRRLQGELMPETAKGWPYK